MSINSKKICLVRLVRILVTALELTVRYTRTSIFMTLSHVRRLCSSICIVSLSVIALPALAQETREQLALAGQRVELNGVSVTTTSSLAAGDTIRFVNTGAYQGTDIDALITIESIRGSVVLIPADAQLRHTPYSARNDDHTVFTIELVESGTSNPVTVDRFGFTGSDVDASTSRDLSDVFGYFGSPATVELGSEIVAGSFINGNGPSGATVYFTDPARVGDPTNWLDEESRPTGDTRVDVRLRYNNFSSETFVFGMTGSSGETPSGRSFFLNGAFLLFYPPVATDDLSENNPTGDAVTVDVLANDTDLDATGSGPGAIDPATVQLAGTTSPGDPLIVAGEGTWSVNTSTGAITFTPEADFTGNPADVDYTVADDQGNLSNPATVTVGYTVAPVAVDDESLGNAVGAPAVVDVLANDTVGGQPLDPATVQIAGTTNPGDPLVVTGEGTWSVDPTTGAITFTPETGFTSNPTDVSYTVADDQGNLSNPATVTVGYVGLTIALALDASSQLDGAQPGDILTYTTTVENTGPVALTDVDVTDQLGTLSETIPNLAPGEVRTFVHQYEVTSTDITSGMVANQSDTSGTADDGVFTAVSDVSQEIETPLALGLIGAIDDPLKEILEADLRETITKQSRLFQSISGGARNRLVNYGGDVCVRQLNDIVTNWPILFDTDKAIIKPESQPIIDELALVLARCEESRIEIGGHTDFRASDAYNIALSQRRVNAVLQALSQRGVDTSNLVARGYGEHRPIADNSTPEGMARNRRVEFTLIDGDVSTEPCGQVRAFDVDGSAEAGTEGMNGRGIFGEETYDCVTGVRQILRGEFSVSREDGFGTQAMINATLQRERLVNDDHLRGYFIGGYLSRSVVTSTADGEIIGYGAYGGIYGANRIEKNIFLDYYLAGSAGRHHFDLRFTRGLPETVNAEGAYDYLGIFGGLAMSGEAKWGRAALTPRAGVDLSYALAGDAEVTASTFEDSVDGRIPLDDQQGVRIFGELGILLEEERIRSDSTPGLEVMSVTPRIYCDMAVGTGSEAVCGLGAGLEYSFTDANDGTTWGAELDAETSGDISRGAIGVFYERPIFGDNGMMRLGSDVTERGRANIAGELELKF